MNCATCQGIGATIILDVRKPEDAIGLEGYADYQNPDGTMKKVSARAVLCPNGCALNLPEEVAIDG